jgi:hypothetical protein
VENVYSALQAELNFRKTPKFNKFIDNKLWDYQSFTLNMISFNNFQIVVYQIQRAIVYEL